MPPKRSDTTTPRRSARKIEPIRRLRLCAHRRPSVVSIDICFHTPHPRKPIKPANPKRIGSRQGPSRQTGPCLPICTPELTRATTALKARPTTMTRSNSQPPRVKVQDGNRWRNYPLPLSTQCGISQHRQRFSPCITPNSISAPPQYTSLPINFTTDFSGFSRSPGD